MAALVTADTMSARRADWRVGPVVYQVFVDRFAPPSDPAGKKALLKAPRRLMDWAQTPLPGQFDATTRHWTHELDFWGGDIAGLRAKLGYIKGLGADVVYTTPIFQSFTNHRYDTGDYRKVDPLVGDEADVRGLAGDVHRRQMKLVLDGVFNHMGATSAAFKGALADPKDPHRNWFRFGSQYQGGYQGWSGVPSLPQLNTSDPSLGAYLWSGRDSVVKHWLGAGADGWRLDVAFDLGPKVCGQIRQASHEAKPGSLVVGEVSGYPAGWADALDGVFNFYDVGVTLEMLKGNLAGGRAGKLLERSVQDAGIEHALRSWTHFDNHDTSRAASIMPDPQLRNLAFAVQFTMPGSPVVYYGSELGMLGVGDPGSRGPMRWDLADPKTNPTLAWVGHLARLRKKLPALRYGDFALLDSEKLLAYLRVTDKALETVMVVVNPLDQTVTETLPFRQGKVMSWGELRDVENGSVVRAINGIVHVTMKPRSVGVFVPVERVSNGYSQYGRIDSGS